MENQSMNSNRRKNKYDLVLLIIAILLSSCNNKLQSRVMPILHYQLMLQDSDVPIIQVILLHAYKMKKADDSKIPAVNLYVCQKRGSKDSLFVFDIDENADRKFFDAGYIGEGLIIDRRDIKNMNTLEVAINVPSDFRIPSKIQYVFAKIYQPND